MHNAIQCCWQVLHWHCSQQERCTGTTANLQQISKVWVCRLTLSYSR